MALSVSYHIVLCLVLLCADVHIVKLGSQVVPTFWDLSDCPRLYYRTTAKLPKVFVI